MEGGLATCRIAKRFCNPKKNTRKDFSWAGSGNGIVSCQKIASQGGRLSNTYAGLEWRGCKETSLRLAQRTSFDATKNVAPCACRRGVRMLHSSWAWRCFSHHFLANQYKGMGGFFQNKPTPPCSPFSWRASDNERERRAKGR